MGSLLKGLEIRIVANWDLALIMAEVRHRRDSFVCVLLYCIMQSRGK